MVYDGLWWSQTFQGLAKTIINSLVELTGPTLTWAESTGAETRLSGRSWGQDSQNHAEGTLHVVSFWLPRSKNRHWRSWLKKRWSTSSVIGPFGGEASHRQATFINRCYFITRLDEVKHLDFPTSTGLMWDETKTLWELEHCRAIRCGNTDGFILRLTAMGSVLDKTYLYRERETHIYIYMYVCIYHINLTGV